MALAAVRSKAVVILLWIHCSMLLQLLIVGCVWPLFCNVTYKVLSSFTIISHRKRELVALL